MDDYFTSFLLLTHVELNIWATGMLNKSRLRKCTITGQIQLQKKERVPFEQRTSSLSMIHSNSCDYKYKSYL